MGKSRLQGITLKIGGDTTGLDKALQGTNKGIGDTQKRLSDVQRLLKLDPKNTELLRQKQELLAEAVEQTSGKLDQLNKAGEEVGKTVKNYDAWKAAYEPVRNAIDATSEKLKKLKMQQAEMQDLGEIDTDEYKAVQQEIADTAKELKELKNQAKKVNDEFGNPISKEQYDALQREIIETEANLRDLKTEANRTGDSLEEVGEKSSNFLDHLKAEAIVEGAKGLLSTLRDTAEETKEYQKIMGSLEISSDRAGYSTEQTTEIYRQLYGVLGDDQTAATTTANLQAIGLNQEKLQRILNATIGAWATYGDSIPIDGLAEAINETVKVGKVTGTFADVLNWAGISEDDFNTKLEATGSEIGRANLVLQQLASQGLETAGNAWKENSAVLYENNVANAEYQEQLAKLGETVMPAITKVMEMTTSLLSKFNSMDEGGKKTILTIIALVAAMGPLIGAVGSASKVFGLLGGDKMNLLKSGFSLLSKTVLPGVGKAFSSVFGFIAANPVVLLIAAIVGLVALIAAKGDEAQAILQKVDDFLQKIFAKDWTEVFGPVLGSAMNAFMLNVKNIWNSIKQILDGVINFIRGVFSGDWSRAWEGVKQIFSGIFSGLVSIAKAPLNGIIGLLNGAISAINSLVRGFNGLSFKMPKWLGGGSWSPSLPSISHIPYLAKGGIVSRGSAVVGDAGPELLTMMGTKAMVQPLSGNQTTSNHYMGGVTMNIYGAPGQDVSELADYVMDRMETIYRQKEAAMA